MSSSSAVTATAAKAAEAPRKLTACGAVGKNNWVGVLVEPPLDVLVAAEKLRTLKYPDAAVLSGPEQAGEATYHITLCHVPGQTWKDAFTTVCEANLATDDFKWGEVWDIAPNCLKTERKTVIVVNIISEKMDDLVADLEIETGSHDSDKKTNGDKTSSLYVVLMCIQTPLAKENKEEKKVEEGGGGGEDASRIRKPPLKRAADSLVDDNPSPAKRANTRWTKHSRFNHDLCEYLYARREELKGVSLPLPSENLPDSMAFRVWFEPDQQWGVSIICPFDIEELIIETAIVHKKRDLVFLSCMGYEDVCRFKDKHELFEEIRRLAASAHKFDAMYKNECEEALNPTSNFIEDKLVANQLIWAKLAEERRRQ